MIERTKKNSILLLRRSGQVNGMESKKFKLGGKMYVDPIGLSWRAILCNANGLATASYM